MDKKYYPCQCSDMLLTLSSTFGSHSVLLRIRPCLARELEDLKSG